MEKEMELKDFEKFLKICQKYGVLDINFYGIKAHFSDKEAPRDIADTAETLSDDEGLSPEQLMFYSAG